MLAIAAIIGVWGISKNNSDQIKKDINKISIAGCFNSQVTYKKYNDFLEDQIASVQETRIINIQRGDAQRAESNRKSIERLQKDFVDVPSDAECLQPILK